MELQSKTQVSDWQRLLIEWFRENGKNYPWRTTSNPYEILVSELMLQQTRIKAVLEKRYFEKWLEKFPDTQSLAKSDEATVLKAWEGLGYYNRARNLQKAAQHIETLCGGAFPETLEEVKALPGVGPYTAGAVLSFAFDKSASIVDGNVIRILARIFHYEEPVDTTLARKQFWDWAGQLTPQRNCRLYNSAIMELGQQICFKSKPRCEACPVAKFCASQGRDDLDQIPHKARRTEITRKREDVLLWIANRKIFLSQESGSRREGLWSLPRIQSLDQEKLRKIHDLTYPITRFQVNLNIYIPKGKTKETETLLKELNGQWFDLDEELPALGAPYIRAISESEAILVGLKS